MAAVSLSPSPIPRVPRDVSYAAMSTRRAPLSNNPNAANSPLRGGSASALHAKTKRSFANVQREEAYGQPPPLKKQILDNGSQRPVRSPSTLAQRSRNLLQVQRSKTKTVAASAEPSHKVVQEKEFLNWQKQHRAKFPTFVFYFDSVPDDVRNRLLKHIGYLGAREEKFFSINVTHVVTTRAVPPPEASADSHAPESSRAKHEADDQPQTINPSLLDCSSESRRKMLFELGSRRAAHVNVQDDIVKLKPSKNTDVLYKARSMGKRIYTIEKLQRILDNLLSGDEQASKSLHMRQQSHETNLAKLLQNERINGPSDRDPRAVTRDLNYFRGPYIYVYDMDEKTKPIMVREYAKVADKAEGEWPQFKTVSQGRCPFVDETAAETKLLRRAMEKKEARVAAEKALLEREKASKAAPAVPVPTKRVVTGKRGRDDYADPLAETKQGKNRLSSVRPTELFKLPKDINAKNMDFGSQKFFTGRNGNGRVFAGEPVASGVQPSNITSAIRSQMISSNANAPGAKAGTSREVHNLQKKVLSKGNAASHDLSSRRVATGQSMDGLSSRSASFTKAPGRTLDVVEEADGKEKVAPAKTQAQSQAQSQVHSQAQAPAQKSKKDMKPGYCENCQDKFADFDDHIISRKHRRFAESKDNWGELDDLLSLLKREPRYPRLEDEGYQAADADDDDQEMGEHDYDYWC